MKKLLYSILFFVILMLMSCTLPVSAAPGTSWLCNNKSKCKMSVEAGQTFYMNRLLERVPYDGKSYCLTKYVEGTWKSGSKSVATVKGKDGLVTTKKPGKTTITVKYNGKTYTCTLTVKKKGSLISGGYKNYEKADWALKAYSRSVPEPKIANCLTAYRNYEKALGKVEQKLDVGTGTLIKKKNCIIYQTKYASKAHENLSNRIRSELLGSLTIQKATCVSPEEIILTLKSPVTQLQKDMIDFYYCMEATDWKYEASDLAFSKLVIETWDEDGEPLDYNNESTGIYGYCEFKAGSNSVTFTPSPNCGVSCMEAEYVSCNGDKLFRIDSDSFEGIQIQKSA